MEIMAVVKADAYGHCAEQLAVWLDKQGVTQYMVASLDEALQLRGLLPEAHILVASPPAALNLPVYAEYKLDVSVSAPDVAAQVLQAGQQGLQLGVHVKVETGMNRLGINTSLAPAVIRSLLDSPNLTVKGIFSHFASSGAPDKAVALQQIQRANEVLDQFPDFEGYFHIGNSGALLNLREHIGKHKKEFIRLGGALVGIPSEPALAKTIGLKPAMTLKSSVIQIKQLNAGDAVSYGHTWHTMQDTQIAIIGAGYADGYPSGLSGKASVMINNHPYPVVGRVCMDMFMVDLGAANRQVQVGDEVILFGDPLAGAPDVYDLANLAGMIHYEICCGIPKRVPRRLV